MEEDDHATLLAIVRFGSATWLMIASCLGTFGNILLIWTTIKYSSLQNKSGILLAITAGAHLICIYCEIYHAYTLAFAHEVSRRACFYVILPFPFMVQFQCSLIFAMVLDLLLAVVKPLWYKRYSTKKYIIIILIPCTIYGSIFMKIAADWIVDDIIPKCSIVMVFPSWMSSIRLSCNMTINSLTIGFQIATVCILRKRARDRNLSQMRSMSRRVGVMALMFVCSFFMASMGANITTLFVSDPAIRAAIQSAMGNFAIICYSQNFYICAWRSKKYRSAFWNIMTGRSDSFRNTTIISHSVSTVEGISKSPSPLRNCCCWY